MQGDMQTETHQLQRHTTRVLSSSFIQIEDHFGRHDMNDHFRTLISIIAINNVMAKNSSKQLWPSSTNYFFLFLCFFFIFNPSSFSSSLYLWHLTWLVRPGRDSIVQLHTCLLYWHLSENMFPLNISPHIILHFLYNTLSLIFPLLHHFLA